MVKIILKDVNRLETYGEIIPDYRWHHVVVDGKSYFKVDYELYSVEKGECIYNPTNQDIVDVIKSIIAYFGGYSTRRIL